MTSSIFKRGRPRGRYHTRTVILSRERVKRSEGLPYPMETKDGHLWREIRRDDVLDSRKGWSLGRRYVHYVHRWHKNAPNPR